MTVRAIAYASVATTTSTTVSTSIPDASSSKKYAMTRPTSTGIAQIRVQITSAKP